MLAQMGRARLARPVSSNCPLYAIREQRIDLGFLRHFNIIAKLVPQVRKAKVMRRWQDGEHVAGIAGCVAASMSCASRSTCSRADISHLVAEGHLKGSARQDQEAVAKAVGQFLANSSIG